MSTATAQNNSKMTEGTEMTTLPNDIKTTTKKQTSNSDVNQLAESEKDVRFLTYKKIVYIALFNAIVAFLILLIVVILVMQSGHLTNKSNNVTGGTLQNDGTPIPERIIIRKNIINHHTTINISMKPNYTFIFDEPNIGPFEGFDFYHTEPTPFPTHAPTPMPTAAPTECGMGSNRLIDTTTLNGWILREQFEEPGEKIFVAGGEASCIGINPCIWIRGISGGAIAYNYLWIERKLNTSQFNSIEIQIKAATTSMDHIGEYGYIETVCINENSNYTNGTLFNDGHTGYNIPYVDCILVNTINCDSLILRIGGYISGVGDLIYISEVRIFPPINDWNSTNEITNHPKIDIQQNATVMSETWYPGGWYGWSYKWWGTYNYAFLNDDTPGGWQVHLPFEMHVKYGDKLVFRKIDDWGIDDLILVSKQMFETCNFSTISDWNKQVTAASAPNNWLRDKYGLYDYPSGNSSDWKPYVFEIIDRSEYPIYCIRDELLAGDILYFTSSARWNNPYPSNSWPSCGAGFKLKVVIEGYKQNILTLLNTNIAAVVNSDEMKSLQASIGYLSRTALLQQFSDEQRIRSEGDSGLTNVRGYHDGERSYDDGTYSNGAVASIHDHSNNIRIVGIGEISAVLNGVEFATRHNDYNLNMPSETSSDYHAVQSVPFVDVPPEILNMNNTNDQMNEMIEYLRAFKTQNKSHRNYTLYFKPILCYVEGTWILSNQDLDEPFSSDRHQLDASSWKQLHDKIRWMMNGGRKEPAENLAHLPSSIRSLYNNTYPIISNWEYRILCSPLKNDISTKRFQISDDLHIQLLGAPETRKELYYSRRARFELNKWIDKNNPDSIVGLNDNYWWNEGRKTWNYLDYLMEQIPGKNNYLANLTDELPDGTARVIDYNDNTYINSGYYNRYYGLTGADAMGSTKHRRGWSDRYLFAAKTTQKKVSPISFDYEITQTNEFISTQSRWSYAIPLEIIYQTPLTKWNPYNITYYSDNNEWQSINAGRSGSCAQNDEYIGWSIYNSYFTPVELFESTAMETSGADTVKDGICVLDNNGISHQVKASGHWITFPSIANNVGKIRQRYPIFPIHYGRQIGYKEVKALKDTILNKQTYDNIENGNGISFWTDDRDLKYGFTLLLSGGNHEHEIYIPGWMVNYYWFDNLNQKYKNGSNYIIQQTSSIANTHQHNVKIYRYKNNNINIWNYKILQCRYGTDTDTDQALFPFQNNSCADFHTELIRDNGGE